VVNKGYNPDRGMWQKTDGVAYFTGEPSRAALKISFFGPFYGSYNVIALDKEYRYALVCGPDRDYLWLLARAPTIAPKSGSRCWILPPGRALISANWSGSISATTSAR
jgi:apolipoprotein D and lipocalin family protein